MARGTGIAEAIFGDEPTARGFAIVLIIFWSLGCLFACYKCCCDDDDDREDEEEEVLQACNQNSNSCQIGKLHANGHPGSQPPAYPGLRDPCPV